MPSLNRIPLSYFKEKKRLKLISSSYVNEIARGELIGLDSASSAE